MAVELRHSEDGAHRHRRTLGQEIIKKLIKHSVVPKFAGSNPAETVGFLRAKKSSARLPSEGK
jgi:hypothetical protein